MTMENLLCTSSKIHWRMILDLSNLAKRECKISRARKLFQIVVHLQPFAYQGWLDYATMEEEAGKISKARKLLFTALKFTPYNENLFIKCLRLEERHGTVDTVRRLLGTLKSIPSRNSWRLVLEGALFEGRYNIYIYYIYIYIYLYIYIIDAEINKAVAGYSNT